LSFQPPRLTSHSEAAMAHALVGLWPQYLIYAASFITIGIMWFNHYGLFHHVTYVSYSALVANLILLMLVAFLPFPTMLLGAGGLLGTEVFFYSFVLLLISLCFGVLYYVAMLRPDERGSVAGFARSRTIWNTLGLLGYAAAMALSLAHPLAGIIIIAAIAVFYMLPSTVAAALAAGATTNDEG
jgi:TMEM175 potassium channel family protein